MDDAVGKTLSGLGLSIISSVAIALLFTRDVVLSLLVFASLVFIVVALLGLFWGMQWCIGAMEMITLTILVGLSCDFTLHIAMAYIQKGGVVKKAADRGLMALREIGGPIVASATTTVLACLPMTWCTIQLFVRVGSVLILCMLLSIVTGVFVFAPVLMAFGPPVGGLFGNMFCPSSEQKDRDDNDGDEESNAQVVGAESLQAITFDNEYAMAEHAESFAPSAPPLVAQEEARPRPSNNNTGEWSHEEDEVLKSAFLKYRGFYESDRDVAHAIAGLVEKDEADLALLRGRTPFKLMKRWRALNPA